VVPAWWGEVSARRMPEYSSSAESDAVQKKYRAEDQEALGGRGGG